MYAVIETGGKQYRVELGTELEVELLDAEAGQSVTLERVLLVADGDEASIGRPLVANAAVQAEVVRQTRGEKVISFKYRPKARRRVKKGHRQELTVLRVTDLVLDGRSAAAAARKANQDAKTERERLAEAAARQAAEDARLAARLAAQAKPVETTPAEATPAKPKAAKATPAKAKAKAAKSAEAEAAGASEAGAQAPARPKRARAAAKEPAAAPETAPDTETEAKAPPKRPRAKKSE
jgi:large subunit ribosomal protein L21